MHITSLNEKEINFNDLEKKIYKYACEEACGFMKEVLAHLDRRLMDERDTKVYRNKGLRHTCIKTIMGNVEFDRRIYEYKTDDGKIAKKYLLDEYLQMDTIGHISSTLVEKITEMITLIVADVNKKVGKGKVYPIYHGKIPFTGYANTNGRKAIRSLVQNKNFNDLRFI